MSNNKEMKDNCLCLQEFRAEFLTFFGFVLFANVVLNLWEEVQLEIRDLGAVDIINKDLQEPEELKNVTNDETKIIIEKNEDSEPEYDKLD